MKVILFFCCCKGISSVINISKDTAKQSPEHVYRSYQFPYSKQHQKKKPYNYLSLRKKVINIVKIIHVSAGVPNRHGNGEHHRNIQYPVFTFYVLPEGNANLSPYRSVIYRIKRDSCCNNEADLIKDNVYSSFIEKL